MKRFILFSGKRHPRELGAAEVTAFLNYLALQRHVAASTQNQVLAALTRESALLGRLISPAGSLIMITSAHRWRRVP
jgi:hypothetical protein